MQWAVGREWQRRDRLNSLQAGRLSAASSRWAGSPLDRVEEDEMKPVMITAGIAAMLLATAAESRAEPTYIDEIKIVTDDRRGLELTVYSNNLTCGPKSLSYNQAKADPDPASLPNLMVGPGFLSNMQWY